MHKCVVIGFGKIGKALKKKINELLDLRVAWIVRRNGIYDHNEKFLGSFNPETFQGLDQVISEEVVCAFLATPSYPVSNENFNFISYFIRKRIPVITCEKVSLAYHFNDLIEHMKLIGYTATVGGGLQMIPFIKRRVQRNFSMHTVLNGTLNYVFDAVQHNGFSLPQAIGNAEILGYTEPTTGGVLGVLNSEVNDVLMKSSILYNLCLLRGGRQIHPHFLTPDKITEADVRRLGQESDRRYVVSFYNSRAVIPKEDYIGGFSYKADGWKIIGGFRRFPFDPLVTSWLSRVSKADNSVMTCEGEDGVYTLTGPGAGAHPTVSAMISDARILLKEIVCFR